MAAIEFNSDPRRKRSQTRKGSPFMRLEGTHLFAAPRTAVWDALMDPNVLSRALPGGEQLELVGENRYRAVMNVKVGPVQGRFEGKIELGDIVAPERYVMKVDGQGAPGFVNGEGELHLAEQDGGTLLTYAGDVNVGGRIAGVGQRLMESTAKSVTRQGLAVLDQMIQASLQPAQQVDGAPAAAQPATAEPERVQAGPGARATVPPHLPAAQAPAPSAAAIGVQVAKDVARDIASDYIPADKQERVLYFGLGALAMLLFVVLVRLVQKD
jgi:carbon monoxide dehydrogenase subunit G